MPGDDLTHGPPAERNAGGSHHRCSRSTGIPCAVALRLLRDLPGDRLDCPHHRRDAQASLPTWSQHRETRTTRLDRAPPVVRPRDQITLRHRDAHRIPASRIVTIARNAPLIEAGWEHDPHFL